MKKYIAIASALLLGTANSCLQCGQFALIENDLAVEANRYRTVATHPIFAQNVHEEIFDDLLNVQAAYSVEQEEQDIQYLKHLRHQLKTRTMTLQTVRQNIKNHGIDINDHLLEAVFSRKEIQLLKEDLQSIKDMIRQIKVKQSRSLILDQIYGHLVQSSPLVAMPQNHYKRTIMQKDFDQFLQVQGDMNYKKKLEILKRTQEYIRSGGSLEKAVEYINQKGISLDDELIDKVFDRKEQKLLKQASQQLSVSLSKQSSNEEIPDHSSRSLLISELYPSVKDYSSKSAQPTIQICQLFGILSDALYAQED